MLINLNKNSLDIEIDLPLSKSESNRALMIAFYSNSDFNKLTLSNSDDTILLKNLLEKINSYIRSCEQSRSEQKRRD